MAHLYREGGAWKASGKDAKELDGVDELIAFPADKITDSIRRACQNRLMWKWLHAMEKTEVEEHKGTIAEDWLTFFKEKCLAKIYERDDHSYATMIESLRELYKHDQRLAMDLRNGVIALTSTTTASVKQFSELLVYIDRFCAAKGIHLPADPGLEKIAINETRRVNR